MKYAFIRRQGKQHALGTLCRLLQVSRSGYHEWLDRPDSARDQADRHFLQAIRQVHVEHREAYGALKTWQALNRRGIACGKHRVARPGRKPASRPDAPAGSASRSNITRPPHQRRTCCNDTSPPSYQTASGPAT